MAHPTYPISSSSSISGPSGLGLWGGGVAENIHIQHTIQHVFTVRISDKWERPLKRYMDKFLDLSLYYAESFRFISVGIGSFFFLWGVSKVVAAGNDRDHDVEDGGKGNVSNNKNSSKSKSRSSRKGASDNATVTTQTSKSTTRQKRRTIERQDCDADELPSPPTTIAFESIDEIQEFEEANK
jgi:hypothetical protein